MLPGGTDDAQLLPPMQHHIQDGSGLLVEVVLDRERRGSVENTRPIPPVIMGAGALESPGQARVYLQVCHPLPP